MIYGTDADLDTLERNAWQRGDYAQAEAYAAALAEREALEATEKELQDVRESLPDLGVWRQQVGEIMGAIESAARVSDREGIMALLQKLHDDISKADGA